MKKQHYANEHGEMTINGHKMAWVMKRCRNASAFGLRSSRIFYLEIYKDGKKIGVFDRGWNMNYGRPDKDDEETNLCISYLVDKFGKEQPKKKKEMGFAE